MAEEYAIPVIADEIYGDMSFAGHTFHRMSELTTEVPILSSGGISKRFLVPGWRLGWIVCYDKHDRLKESGVRSFRSKQPRLNWQTTIRAAMSHRVMHLRDASPRSDASGLLGGAPTGAGRDQADVHDPGRAELCDAVRAADHPAGCLVQPEEISCRHYGDAAAAC